MPSYGGIAIFGEAVSMVTSDNPREKQINAFFGLSGLELIDGGLRGRVTRANGILVGVTAQFLLAAESQFRSFNDGVARTLVDTLGGVWPFVRLEAFQPVGRVRRAPSGVYFRTYQARFLHLE